MLAKSVCAVGLAPHSIDACFGKAGLLENMPQLGNNEAASSATLARRTNSIPLPPNISSQPTLRLGQHFRGNRCRPSVGYHVTPGSPAGRENAPSDRDRAPPGDA